MDDLPAVHGTVLRAGFVPQLGALPGARIAVGAVYVLLNRGAVGTGDRIAREADGVLRLADVVRYEVEVARRRRLAHLVDVVPVVDIDFQRAAHAGLEMRGLGDVDPGKRAATLAACRSEAHTSELKSALTI